MFVDLCLSGSGRTQECSLQNFCFRCGGSPIVAVQGPTGLQVPRHLPRERGGYMPTLIGRDLETTRKMRNIIGVAAQQKQSCEAS